MRMNNLNSVDNLPFQLSWALGFDKTFEEFSRQTNKTSKSHIIASSTSPHIFASHHLFLETRDISRAVNEL